MNLIIIFVLCGAFAVSASLSYPFYRRDYMYSPKHEAFFKVHLGSDTGVWEPISALNVCDKEGSKLYFPKPNDDLPTIRWMANVMTQSISEILVGIHNNIDISELTTIDGQPTPLPLTKERTPRYNGNICVYFNVKNSNYSVGHCSPEKVVPAFVCTRKLEFKSMCPNNDKSYVYEERTKKCYKYNSIPMTWSDAMQTCQMEGGTLLVAKDKQEKTYVEELLFAEKDKLYSSAHIYVGFRMSNVDNQYYTVKGDLLKKISDVYNNGEMTEICGAYVYDYNDDGGRAMFKEEFRPCNEYNTFICEMKSR